MGLFRKKRGGVEFTRATVYEGDDELFIVGESRHQDTLEAICGERAEMGERKACDAVLLPEPENPHDRSAVKVVLPDGRGGYSQVGYLSRENARRLQPGIVRAMLSTGAGVAVRAEIRGGWDRGGADRGHYGVLLFCDWSQFEG